MSTPELSNDPIELTVSAEEAGTRLDWHLANVFSAYSRVHMRRVINAAGVKVNQRRAKASHRLKAGERITIHLPDLPRESPQPENIPLDFLFEDDALVVVNKQPGMVVHPGKGHWSGTLTAALQFHFDQLSSIGGPTRPGIVHRLDRDTSGVMVVAKTDAAHLALAAQFEARTVEKEYLAVVVGNPELDRDVIELPIGPHPQHREKMMVRSNHANTKSARSFYEVQERLVGFALVSVKPKTGRTHQIRVHLASQGYPVLCDRLYGSRAQLTQGEIAMTDDPTPILQRQALHAWRLSFQHPTTGQALQFQSPLPPDMQQTLDLLREYRAK